MNTVYVSTQGKGRVLVIVAIAAFVMVGWLVYTNLQDQKINVSESTEPTSNQAPYLKTQAELEAEAAIKQDN